MNKFIKNAIVCCAALMLSVTCAIPAALAAGPDVASDDSVVYLGYDEYTASKDHYTALAKEGYTLVIYVGDENEEAELERINSESSTMPDVLQSPVERASSIPIYRYNVMNGKKTISGSCDDTMGYSFTLFNYYGCSSYEVSLYNRGDTRLSVDLVPEGELSAFVSYKIPAKSTVIKYVTQSSWYGRFANPCSVNGYVARDK